MERYNKKTMSIHSKEYDNLLQKEIDVWSTYRHGETHVVDFEALKKTHAYLTYRKGTVELELQFIKDLGEEISVLELGSADGWLTNEILNFPSVKTVTSIDISLENNKEKYSEKSIAIRGDLNKVDEIQFDQQYDCIITHGTLHHLVDPRKTLQFCVDNLLKKGGILIVNDTWTLEKGQLTVNAFFYLLLNRLPHAILDLNFKNFFSIIFYKIPMVLWSKDYAAYITHAHETSPFESISSADDYKDLYSKEELHMLHFQNLAALPGLQNSWMRSPLFIKNFIQKIDTFLIKKNILSGDYHIAILKKINN